MRRVAARAAAVLIVVFGFGAVLGVAPARAGGYVPSDETHVRNLVNATRSSKGLGQLASNAVLVGMARRQADRMAAKGNIFHNLKLSDEITVAGLNWLKAGENVGMGPNADIVEDAFLASPHHYENIVDPQYDTVGIGVVDGADGRRYVVQVFADMAASAPAPKPDAAKPATPAVTAEPQAQTAAQVAPVSQTPTPTVQPSVAPAPEAPRPSSADPNVVVGGVVEPLDLVAWSSVSI
jgi:hypothetical protein